MRLSVDLHIHSCLSPCGDAEMTPNNLVNMAWIKGLDAIAVADHNRAGNLAACASVAAQRGLLLVPALEATSSEEVHVLCYFSTVERAEQFDAWLYERLPPVPNRVAFFGEQTYMNGHDEKVGDEPRMLMQASRVSIAEMAAKAAELEGIAVPAHINRGANSLLGVLGVFPQDVTFSAVEVARNASSPLMDLSRYHVLYSSDAHRLEDIAEADFSLEVEDRSVEAILRLLKRYKG